MLYTVQGKDINENAGAACVYLCVTVCKCDYGQMGLLSHSVFFYLVVLLAGLVQME